jgi:hypothetical protein
VKLPIDNGNGVSIIHPVGQTPPEPEYPMRYLYDLDINRHPAPDCFGFALLADAWPDATTPRTERPVRFVAEEAWIGASTFRTLIVS